ncbi:S1/P1 Nuclease [Rhodocytophaga rosea]|uniref:S1/P1 Nuclease n=1 Tax=Rhodocytophaga rosea TaxID=2704465 RepID=A0A6C0GFR0_9BACT|nr:zinc dependent phospholipase C family protein [Rhodocytophaga rosea]QHT66664.1 S1/P1 Nuclease [Rhodocytophaga rosea]
MTKYIFAFLLCMSIAIQSYGWGFYAHQRINRLAVFGLPPEMIVFYKHYILYLTENAVNPDKRRYAVDGEAPRHYIDMDVYGDSALYKLPHHWKEAVAKYTEDTLQTYGIVPWHINFMKYQLTEAFKQKDVNRILRISADLGHYIGDAHVPLHTTENYNGQLTGQHGIHGLWESRLPELFAANYDFFSGTATYLTDTQETAWQSVAGSHMALDSVLRFEKELTKQFAEDKKYSFEQRGNITVRVYSQAFSKAYHRMLAGQVERRMKASIKMVSDFWYTAWVDAGQPDLVELTKFDFTEQEKQKLEEEKQQWEKRHVPSRPHESGLFQLPSTGITSCEHIHIIGDEGIPSILMSVRRRKNTFSESNALFE